ncbi:uncharacterized protein LOC110636521 isoform X1 [Hevea brasiliensis]|uniref:uncharacterized protein LOC110636521 isoform X1 n=1 Tax=Hevea brasiliensis TaxID=3981 RepID=UPI0025D90CFE|nr:uncharacterized protein LOC110636521 isoform X1 [Hevea brasiliensis]XP_057999457.1 uncharacterized protein LOC110636521 isoform X1 [Hevea brasiliensis]XP_057999461.1 uncharacterized protein LOC110636521 isoform X1 [Hevea brasiliensis]
MRSKDPFWKYVEIVESNRSRCMFCKEDFAPRNIHRIKLHLAGVRGGIKICTRVPTEVQKEALEAVDECKRKARTSSYSKKNILLPSNIASTDVVQNSLQKDDSVMLLRNSVTNHNLAKFFLLSNIAFDDVEAPYFVDFVKSVPGYDHSYELPSSRELQMKFVPEIEMQAQKYVKDVKKSWEKTGCTIMVENGCNLINILIYSPEGVIFETSYEVSRLEEIDFDFTEIVSSIIEKIGVDHVVQFITNDGKISSSVGEMLETKYPTIYQIRCAAQEIHSFLKVIFDEIAWVRQIIDHAELIFRHMYSNAIVLSLMKQYTKGKELKHPCMSKFASKYQMLQSIFDNKNELQQLIMSDEWYMLDSNNNETARKVTDIIQGANFWHQGHDVLDVLEPIVQVLRLVENDGPNSGYLYGALKRAREAIEGYRDRNATKYQRILELLTERQGNIIHPMHAAAAFLNPTYMFLEDSECWGIDTYNGMNFVSENLVASGEEKAKFIEELQLYRKRSLKEFTSEMSRAIMTSSHPREWWDYNRPLLPVLSKYAIRILSQPCKCSYNIKPSVSEVAQRKKMDSTTSKSWDNHLFVIINTIIMEKFRTMEKSLTNFQNCTELPDYEQDWEDDQMELLINGNSNDDARNETDLLCFKDKVSSLLRPSCSKTLLQHLEASN